MTRRVKNEKGESFTLFFTMVSPFSNFHPCTFFEEDNEGEKQQFCCVEQFYMFMKAALFDDHDTASQVMREKNPKKMKSLGKHVRGFSQQKWDKLSPEVMEKALTAKFSQNKKLRRYLFLSQGSQMVEASPMDAVWGIGLSMDSPDALYPNRWRGTNRLGNIMTAVREKLLQEKRFYGEAEETLREIALKGPNVFDDLQSDPAGSSYNTPQQGFKRRHADSDPRDGKRQRTMDDFVATPSNQSSIGGNSRFAERDVRTEPRGRPQYNEEEEARFAARRERFGGGDMDMRNAQNREENMRRNGEEARMRERIAIRMEQQPPPGHPSPFVQPPRSMLDHPRMHPSRMDNRPPEMVQRGFREGPPQMDHRTPEMGRNAHHMDHRPPHMDQRPQEMGRAPPHIDYRTPEMGRGPPPQMGHRTPEMSRNQMGHGHAHMDRGSPPMGSGGGRHMNAPTPLMNLRPPPMGHGTPDMRHGHHQMECGPPHRGHHPMEHGGPSPQQQRTHRHVQMGAGPSHMDAPPPPMGMLQMPPGYTPLAARGANGVHHSTHAPPLPSLPVAQPPPPPPPSMDIPYPPLPLPMGVPPPPLPLGVPPPPMVEEKKEIPPPPPAPLVIEVQAGVVHSGGKKTEEMEMEEHKEHEEGRKEILISAPKAPKIKMNLQKERGPIQVKSEASPTILSLRKLIREKEELLKMEEETIEKKGEEMKKDEKEEEKEEGEVKEEETGVPKAYAIMTSTPQSEKRNRHTRTRIDSSSEDEKEKGGEKKKVEEAERSRRDNGEKRGERRSDTRSVTRGRKDDSRDRNRRRSDSRDGRDRRSDRSEVRRESRDEEERKRDRREEERKRDESRRRGDRKEEGRSDGKMERRNEDEKRRDSVERKEKAKSPKDEKPKEKETDKEKEKSEKKTKKAAKKEAKAAKKAEKEEKKRRKTADEEGMKSELKEEQKEKEGGELPSENSIDTKEVKKETVAKKDGDDEKKEGIKGEKDKIDNGVNGKRTESKRIPVEAPLSSEHKKHPRIEAPPTPASQPPRSAAAMQQNLFQKLRKMMK